MDHISILVLMGVACFFFAVISSCLIYNHVRDEKERVYRARMRRQKDQMGPCGYLKQITNAEQKPPLTRPAVGITEIIKNSNPVPVPGHALDSLTADEFPVKVEAKPSAELKEPTIIDLAPVIQAMTVPATIFSTTEATTYFRTPPAGRNANPTAIEKESAPKKEKRRRGRKTLQDFEDYRNFSPKLMPPPKVDPLAMKCDSPMSQDYLKERITQPTAVKSIEQWERYDHGREGLSF